MGEATNKLFVRKGGGRVKQWRKIVTSLVAEMRERGFVKTASRHETHSVGPLHGSPSVAELVDNPRPDPHGRPNPPSQVSAYAWDAPEFVDTRSKCNVFARCMILPLLAPDWGQMASVARIGVESLRLVRVVEFRIGFAATEEALSRSATKSALLDTRMLRALVTNPSAPYIRTTHAHKPTCGYTQRAGPEDSTGVVRNFAWMWVPKARIRCAPTPMHDCAPSETAPRLDDAMDRASASWPLGHTKSAALMTTYFILLAKHYAYSAFTLVPLSKSLRSDPARAPLARRHAARALPLRRLDRVSNRGESERTSRHT